MGTSHSAQASSAQRRIARDFRTLGAHHVPTIECNVPHSSALLGKTLLVIVQQLIDAIHGDCSRALLEFADFFAAFDTPNNSESRLTADVLRRILDLRIECLQYLTEIPAPLQHRFDVYHNTTISEIRRLTANVQPPIDLPVDLFEDGRGLMSAPQSPRDYVKGKAILEIGAWYGDSAIAYAKYAKTVYSFEVGPEPFA
jgi:hypothetical protein